MVFKKRWLFAILALILVFSLLPGCAGEKASPAEPPAVTPTPEIPAKAVPVPVEEISLEEAEEMVGIPIAPKYLPAGYEFQRAYNTEIRSPRADLRLFFSDEEITGDFETTADDILLPQLKIILVVMELPETPSDDARQRLLRQAEARGDTVIDASEVKGYLPPNRVSLVDMNGVKAYLSTGETGYSLQWNRSYFFFELVMLRELPVEELIKIAESIG